MSDDLTAEELEVKDDTEVNEDELDTEVEDNESEENEGEDEPTPGDDDLKDLQSKLEEMEESNKGLVSALSAQRGQRQDLQDQLTELKDALTDAKEQTQTVKPDELEAADLDKIPVDFDDDGNMSIDPKYLPRQDTTDLQAIQNELNLVKNTLNHQHMVKQETNSLNALLSEKEGYKDAHKVMTDAWEYMKNDLFEDYLTTSGVTPPSTPDQAIDMIMATPKLIQSFEQKYPSVDLESTLEAHLLATPRYLRKALNNVLTDVSGTNETLDLGRPASLANANSSGSNSPESLLSRVADMSTEDYENLDERTLLKIDKLMEKIG